MSTHISVKIVSLMLGLSCSLAAAKKDNNINNNTADIFASKRSPTVESLAIEKDLQVGKDLEVFGKGLFKKKLHVHGESKFDEKIDAEGGLKVEHSSCFDGTVAIKDDHKLLVNEIHPIRKHSCIDEDDNGTTCFGGNVSVASDKTLLVNKIDPVSQDDCTLADDCGTTEFSGNVRCDKDLDFPATAIDQNCQLMVIGSTPTVGAITVNGERFIHNFGPTEDASDRNTFIGLDAGNFNLTGCCNTAAGYQTLQSLTSGQSNVGVGDNVLNSNQDGSNNIGMGHTALYNNVSGNNNVALGRDTLVGVNADDNTAVGHQAQQNNNVSGTTAVGYQALNNNSHNNITGIGYQALLNNQGDSNTAVGDSVLKANTTGSDNTALGFWSLLSNQIGNNNVAVGDRTLESNSTNFNTAVGSQALTANTTGNSNTALGYQALFRNVIGNNNVAVGDSALLNSTANQNTAVGSAALNNIGTGSSNIGIGSAVGSAYTGAESDNIVIGNDGVTGDSGITRIGTPATGPGQNKCFVAGIYNVAPDDIATVLPVVIDDKGQLGTNLNGGTVCFDGDVALGDSDVLFVNEINPVKNCDLDDTGTTAFSGYVIFDKNIDLPPTSSSAIGVFTVGLTGVRFIHNYGPAGDASDGNTFVGLNAGNFGLTGANNTAMGFGSLTSNILGSSNSAFGSSALEGNYKAQNNTAVGAFALKKNDSGTTGAAHDNTAVGFNSLSQNINGYYNTAVGSGALENSDSIGTAAAHNNTAVGFNSLNADYAGAYNTAVGSGALDSNTTGTYNIALGYRAGTVYDEGESNNIVIGNEGEDEDNNVIRIGRVSPDATGVTPHGSCFIAGIDGVTPPGTLDPVVINSNGQLGTSPAGNTTCFNGNVALGDTYTLFVNKIDPAQGCTGNDCGTTQFSGYVGTDKSIDLPPTQNDETCEKQIGVITVGATGARFIHNYGPSENASDGNTFVGLNAGNFSMTAKHNTAMGSGSLSAITSGYYNTAVGTLSLFANKTGTQNTALGYYSLGMNQDGNYNTAVGPFSLSTNITGVYNVAVGVNALHTNTSDFNTAVGALALNTNGIGHDDVAVGYRSLHDNTDGYYNTAVGSLSLEFNTDGNHNTAFGYNSLNANTTGVGNTALGTGSLANNTTGSNNIAIGAGVGSLAPVDESNTIRIGNGDQTACYIQGIFPNSSNIPDDVRGLLVDSNGQLYAGTSGPPSLPSSRRYKKDINDMNEVSAQLMQLRPVSFKYKNKPDDAPVAYGLIAEEVVQVYPELVVYNKEGEPDGVRYNQLPALLLNEMQHQQKMLDGHDEKLDELVELLDGHDKQIDGVDAKLDDVVEQLEKLEMHDKHLDLHDKQVNDIFDRLEKLEKSIKRSR